MAEVTHAICTKNPVPVGPHCWHILWRPSPYQAGQQDSQGRRCCWCGEEGPLMTSYAPPLPHGPHAPAELVTWAVGAAAGIGPGYRIVPAGGIPLPDPPPAKNSCK